MKHGKKYNDSAKLIEAGKFYDVEEAVAVAVKTASAKFDVRGRFENLPIIEIQK